MPVYPLPKLDPAPLRAEARRRGITPEAWADLLRIDRNSVYKRIYEPMSWASADRFAIALGLHPALIWGDNWWAIAKAYDQALLETARRREARKAAA